MVYAISLAITAVWGVVSILGQASSPADIDWVTYITHGGPFGVVLLLVIFDKLTTTGERDRLRQENSELQVEVKTLNENIRKEIVPALVQLNQVMHDVVEEISDNRKELRKRV